MFYTVIRQFFKGETETHSMEIKTDKEDAVQRFLAILAADLLDKTNTYIAAYVIDSKGLMIEGRVFSRQAKEVQEEENA